MQQGMEPCLGLTHRLKSSHLCETLRDPEQRCYQASQKDDVPYVKHHCMKQLPFRKSIIAVR